MQRTLAQAPRAIRTQPLSLARQSFSTSTVHQLDPSKDPSDVTEKQAKNPEGANPAAQQAKIVKEQGPGQTQQEGKASQQGGGGSGDGKTEQKGLGGETSESKVNPAVKKS